MIFNQTNHFAYGIILLFLGVVSGLIYHFFYFIRRILNNNKLVEFFIDLILWIGFGVILVYSCYVYTINLPFLYKIFIFFLGFFIENKTFGKTVAFLADCVYNKCKVIYLKIYKKLFSRGSRHGSAKGKTNVRSLRFFGHNFTFHSFKHHLLSVRANKKNTNKNR